MVRNTYLIYSNETNPYYNLALETALLENVPADSCILYLWQNQRTVVIGKNQNPWRECRTALLEADGGYLARRLSGGGAVFHDLGNLNFTFLTNKADYDVDRQLAVILGAVAGLGLDAQRSGRNDITIGGKKFSGNAFYQSGGKCYHHGTLLVDVDQDALVKYLNADPAKLQSKGVDSVRSRVTNLKALLPELTIDQLKGALAVAFGQVYSVTPQPLDEDTLPWRQVAQLTARYGSWPWKYGRRMPFSYQREQRFSWGGAELRLLVEKGQVQDAALYSDGLDSQLLSSVAPLLKGQSFAAQSLTAALEPLAIAEQKTIIRDIQSLLADIGQ